MTPVTILCEGRTCNAGFSAAEREQAHVKALTPQTEEMRAHAERHARSVVSRELRYTPHVRVSGVDRFGRTRYGCTVCQHERVYGTLAHSWEDGPYA
jgi:hypothetical protein